MSDQYPTVILEYADGAYEFVRAKVDDLEKVVIGAPWATLPNSLVFGDFTMIIHMLDGTVALVNRAVAQMLLNDGILSRLRIPIEFMPVSR